MTKEKMEKAMQPERRSPLDLLYEASVEESFLHFRSEMPTSLLFPNKRRQRQFCIRKAMRTFAGDGLYLEFGVFKGGGVNLFANELAKAGLSVYGFDSFEGLEEDWTGHYLGRPAGAYSLQGKVPETESNAHLRVGKIQDTLLDFLAEFPDAKIAFAHMDFDTYTPTEFSLRHIGPRLTEGSIVLFDELYGYPGWRDHEYKALTETIPAECYEYICFSKEAVGIVITRELPQSG